MSHLNGKVLSIQGLHLVQSISLELLGLDPHCHLQHPEHERGQLLNRELETPLKEMRKVIRRRDHLR